MRRTIGLAGGLSAVVWLALGSVVPTEGAVPACRVRNVTQDTSGRSLITMAEKARDGDRLHVRGTCRGEVVIRADIVISGVGQGATLTGRDMTRVVRIGPGLTVTLRDLIIEHGRVTHHDGAGILSYGRLTLVSSIVRLNSGASKGGGIDAEKGLTLRRSRIVRNAASQAGGGVWVGFGGPESCGCYIDGPWQTWSDTVITRNRAPDGGGVESQARLTLVRMTVADNTADHGWGGGMVSYGTLSLIDSTVSGNTARHQGGGIWSGIIFGGTRLSLTGSTVSDNTAGGTGGGIYNQGDDVSLTGSTVTGNSAGRDGGGIKNAYRGTVTQDAASSVSGNTPDDCTPAC